MQNEKLSIYQQILLIALHNIKFPTLETQHRRLARWFSSTFSTPYSDAYKMTFEELLLHKLENDFQDYKSNKLDKIFREEFVSKKEFIKNEETATAQDEGWARNIAAEELKKREAALKTAEDDLLKESGKANENMPKPPPDIKRTF